jgi:hypothetical protein
MPSGETSYKRYLPGDLINRNKNQILTKALKFDKGHKTYITKQKPN